MLRHDRLYCVVGSAVPGLAAGARAGRAGRTLGVLGGCTGAAVVLSSNAQLFMYLSLPSIFNVTSELDPN